MSSEKSSEKSFDPISALINFGGSIISANAQKAAAAEAAQAQQDLLQKQLDYLTQGQANARGAINSMLPSSQGAAGAATAARNNVPYLAPGQGAMFGGQQIDATPTPGAAAPDYSSLLAPQLNAMRMVPPAAQMAPTSGVGTQRFLESTAPPGGMNPNALVQAMGGNGGGNLGSLGPASTSPSPGATRMVPPASAAPSGGALANAIGSTPSAAPAPASPIAAALAGQKYLRNDIDFWRAMGAIF